MHHATASNDRKPNIPTRMPVTLSAAENNPHTKRLRVSLAAWKIPPDDASTICTPTERDRIRKTGTDGVHCDPKIISTTS